MSPPPPSSNTLTSLSAHEQEMLGKRSYAATRFAHRLTESAVLSAVYFTRLSHALASRFGIQRGLLARAASAALLESRAGREQPKPTHRQFR